MKLWFTLLITALACVISVPAANVRLGNEVLAANGFKQLRGKRVGLITNPSGVNSQLVQTVDILHQAPEVNLVALFAPEHGIYGDVPAGDHVQNRKDERTGLTVFSVYGKTRKPTPEMLKGIDALVFDLQDIGCRSYTFISTMGLAMEAAAENNIEFVVLDRPNPLGGERIEGPMLEEKFRSFVSQWDIPYVHGLTTGELARMINEKGWIKKKCKLTIVPMKGWKRSMTWEQTGLPWVPTSPHIPHGDSPMFYVATGVLGELMVANIGVGYTIPFQSIAITNVNMHDFAETMNNYGLPGVRFKPVTYKPYYSTLKDQTVSGVQVYFTEPRRVPLMAINFYAWEGLKKTANIDLFAKAVEAKRGFDMFDKVNGTDKVRKALQEGRPAAEIVASWKAGEDQFRRDRRPYLIY
ncbi:MAG: exo-beta-N-acetylmuramidase NamZ domain-containing protein [Limisphaerales bacterium]